MVEEALDFPSSVPFLVLALALALALALFRYSFPTLP
jgi:hypothetical protein